MRLIIDLQAAQGSSRERGIGRYSRELALAMIAAPRGHEVGILVNGRLSGAADALIETFRAVLPRGAIQCWEGPEGVAELAGRPALLRAAEHVRAQRLAHLAPDIVHVASLFEGMGDDLVTAWPASLERLPTVATCYDLIPLIRREIYLDPAPPEMRRWYYRRLQEMSLCDGLLAISESSRQEAIGHLAMPADRVFNVGTGIAPGFRRVTLDAGAARAVLARYGLREGFILFLGAGDLRKNEEGLISAYALLPPALQREHQLAIVGRMSPETLRAHAGRLGVPIEDFHVVPFVAEEDLTALYSLCALFVFPSLHEGFGLPAAEAMACGAPVIGSNTTSLPEVIGREDALFDPTSPAQIAARMRAVLEDPDLRRSLVEHGPHQAARFTWARAAERAWDALEAVAARNAGAPPRARVLRRRPTLAFVSPLPPQATGIATYARELLVALAAHYDITLVSEARTDDPRLAASFPHRDVAGFARGWADYDRILYHVGNSEFHLFQTHGLIGQAPGVVVMHDAFISDLTLFDAHRGGNPLAFREALYRSDGYPALWREATDGHSPVVRRYSTALPLLRQAIGLILHSAAAQDHYADAFGLALRERTRLIPHLRTPKPLLDRRQARARLGLAEEGFVVCSFGIVSDSKLPTLLADAWRSPGLAREEDLLVFVGQAEGALARELAAAGAARIQVTGRVEEADYELWLAAADVAVQLRQRSRGETSGAVSDAMIAGLPLVTNAHGTARELPEATTVRLPEHPSAAELAASLLRLRDDPELRRTYGEAARAYAERDLSPAPIAAAYRDAIEALYAEGSVPAAAAVVGACGPALAAADTESQRRAARMLAESFRPPAPRQLLLDVSELARTGRGTGIQRVLREVGRRLLPERPGGFRVELVRFHQGRLCYARAAAAAILGIAPLDLPDAPVDAGEGDVLVCLDVSAEIDAAGRADLARLQRAGVRMVGVVYDLLPRLLPACFPDELATQVTGWYRLVLERSDAVICISRQVMADVAAWLDSGELARRRPLKLGWFHLGADFMAPEEEQPPPTEAEAAALEAAAARPTFLMVGTVEPRKGHRHALDAMRRLWDEGVDAGLIIVGGRGWHVDGLVFQLNDDPQREVRLHWLTQASDATLARLYRRCAALLMASEAEGFGLPVVEAAAAGLPVILRDIPVFREVAGDGATYFSGDGAALARVLRQWLEARAHGRPAPGFVPLSWEESVAALTRLLLDDAYQAEWTPPG